MSMPPPLKSDKNRRNKNSRRKNKRSKSNVSKTSNEAKVSGLPQVPRVSKDIDNADLLFPNSRFFSVKDLAEKAERVEEADRCKPAQQSKSDNNKELAKAGIERIANLIRGISNGTATLDSSLQQLSDVKTDEMFQDLPLVQAGLKSMKQWVAQVADPKKSAQNKNAPATNVQSLPKREEFLEYLRRHHESQARQATNSAAQTRNSTTTNKACNSDAGCSKVGESNQSFCCKNSKGCTSPEICKSKGICQESNASEPAEPVVAEVLVEDDVLDRVEVQDNSELGNDADLKSESSGIRVQIVDPPCDNEELQAKERENIMSSETSSE
jgi:hypothetical protein